MDKLQEFEQLLFDARNSFSKRERGEMSNNLLDKYRDLTLFVERELNRFSIVDVDQMIRFNNDDIANEIRNELSDNNG